jgi:hypothetical protein
MSLNFDTSKIADKEFLNRKGRADQMEVEGEDYWIHPWCWSHH